MALSSQNYVFLDCQTTGLSRDKAEILELGWSLSFEEDQVQTRLIKPRNMEAISKTVWRMTGLRPEELQQAPSAEEVWRDVVERASALNATCAVIHYSQFEMPFLQALHTRAFADRPFPWPVLCTYRVARRLQSQLPAKTLRALCGHIGFDLPEQNRSWSHVVATQKIWKHFIDELAKSQSVTSWQDLQAWMQSPAPERKAGKVKKVFGVSREALKALPDNPGVYEMLSRTGQVLYVGKATSLKSRVGSYFQQRKPERSKLNELLTQVVEVRTTCTETPLEAALLENERIKTLEPRYNYSLRTFAREVLFVSAQSETVQSSFAPTHPWGPFTSEGAFESLHRLLRAHAGTVTEQDVLYLNHPPEDFKNALDALIQPKLPGALTLLDLLKQAKRFTQAPTDNEVQASVYRKLRRAVRALHQAAWRCWLMDCRLAWPVEEHRWRYLDLERGRIVNSGYAGSLDALPCYSRPRHALSSRKSAYGLTPSGLALYDGMRVLFTEAMILAKRAPFFVQLSSTRRLLLRPETIQSTLAGLVDFDARVSNATGFTEESNA